MGLDRHNFNSLMRSKEMPKFLLLSDLVIYSFLLNTIVIIIVHYYPYYYTYIFMLVIDG